MIKPSFEEKIFKALMILSVFIVLSSLLIILITILIKGGSALSIDMLVKTSKGGYYLGKEGGILNAILGSIFLALPATALAYIISLSISLSMQKEFMRPKVAVVIRMFLDILWGVPSIVYGIFCLAVMSFLGIGTSLIAGIFALTLLEIPIITRSIEESLTTVSEELKEVSYSLGSTKFETVFKIVRKQAHSGIIAGVLLGFGRGIGDAASILFTAGFSDNIPNSLLDPVATLPMMIFNLFSSPLLEVRERAYASAFILLMLILGISVLSRVLSRKSIKYKVL